MIPLSNVIKLERQKTSLGVLDNALAIDTKEVLPIPLESVRAVRRRGGIADTHAARIRHTMAGVAAHLRSKPTVVRGRFFFVLYRFVASDRRSALTVGVAVATTSTSI